MRIFMEKKRKNKIGALELRIISYVQLKRIKILRTGDIFPIIGISAQTEKDVFSKLNNKGIFVRLTKGYYLVPDTLSPTTYPNVSEMEILFYFMKIFQTQFMISGPTAIYYYGYTTQIPNRIYVYNNKISGDRIIGNKSFVFMKTSSKRLKGAEFISNQKGIKIPYASKARLLIDCIYDWNRYNTIPKVFKWINQEIEENPAITEKLVSNAIRYGNRIVQRRLGYLLEIMNVDAKLVEKLQNKIQGTKTIKPLIPNINLKGSVNKKWGLIINGEI